VNHSCATLSSYISKDRSIVNHHISSFNDFLSTLDNPNSRMQKIVDNLRVSADDAERGIISLDPDRTDGRVVKIRVGRRRDEKTGHIDPQARPTVRIGNPLVREANGATHNLSPMEARLRNLNYLAPIEMDFTVIEDGIEKESEKVHIGDLPIMLRSKRCNLYKENMEEERELSDEEYRRKLMESGEDPADPGGYFIIGGTERVLISLEDPGPPTGSWSSSTSGTAPSWKWPRCSPRRKGIAPSPWWRRRRTGS